MAIRRVQTFNGSAPGANTAVFTAIECGDKFSDSTRPVYYRIGIAVSTSTVVNAVYTDGTTTHKIGLNESGALNAADLYIFDVPAIVDNSDDGGTTFSFTLEYETDSVTEILTVDEIHGVM